VNTSATRVELRVALASLPLSGAERERVRERLRGRITSADEILVVIGTERSQLENRRRAEEVLVGEIDRARRARPARRPTRPSRASVARQRRAKEHRARRKRARARPDTTD